MYLDLVLCKHPNCEKKYLFRAPSYSNLEVGDEVVVETKKGEQPATVLAQLHVDNASREYKFITEFVEAKEPLKRVLKILKYYEIGYEDEEER